MIIIINNFLFSYYYSLAILGSFYLFFDLQIISKERMMKNGQVQHVLNEKKVPFFFLSFFQECFSHINQQVLLSCTYPFLVRLYRTFQVFFFLSFFFFLSNFFLFFFYF